MRGVFGDRVKWGSDAKFGVFAGRFHGRMGLMQSRRGPGRDPLLVQRPPLARQTRWTTNPFHIARHFRGRRLGAYRDPNIPNPK